MPTTGRRPRFLGADGLQGTPDDEEADYGDLWTGVTEANTSVYGLAAGVVRGADGT